VTLLSDETKKNDDSGLPDEPERYEGVADSADDDGAIDDDVTPYDITEEPEPESAPAPPAEAVSAGDAGDQGDEPGEPSSEAEPAQQKTKKSPSERLEQWRAGAVGVGEALSRPGALGWKFYVVMSAGALIAAVVLAITNTRFGEDANFWQKLGPGTVETLRVLLKAPIHLCVGLLAFALTAWAVGVRAGKGDLAAARIGLAVALAVMALELQWSFFGERVVVYLIAFILYFTTVWLAFRCPPRVAGTLVALHAGLYAAIAGLGWLIVWVGL